MIEYASKGKINNDASGEKEQSHICGQFPGLPFGSQYESLNGEKMGRIRVQISRTKPAPKKLKGKGGRFQVR